MTDKDVGALVEWCEHQYAMFLPGDDKYAYKFEDVRDALLSQQAEVARLTQERDELLIHPVPASVVITRLQEAIARLTRQNDDHAAYIAGLERERDRLAREVARLNNEMHGPAADGH